MKPNSLAFRLVLSSAAWTLMVLSVTAAILISIYRDLVETSFDTRLNQYLEYLIARSSPQTGTRIQAPDNLGEPSFTLPLSGWYWQITAKDAAEPVYKSESLVEHVLRTPSARGVMPDQRLVRQAYIDGPEGQLLRAVERDIAFTQGEGRETQVYAFTVAGDAVDIDMAIADFTQTLVLILTVMGGVLLVATFFQVRFGLAPLSDIGVKLAAIRSGKSERLEGALPEEILPLQKELNALIQANTSVVERARTHVGNLAHALKTPLSVITNEARTRNDEFARKVAAQAGLMREQISHHLDRARIAAQIGVVGSVTDVSAELDALSRALKKIYEDRGLTFAIECPLDMRFSGERQDFQEMAGNLMDNACKWASSRVEVKVTPVQAPANGAHDLMQVVIEDDGPGLPEEFRRSAVKRGRRLDETVPGSGLGLSIVADLSGLYQGSLHLEQAESGGLRARLVLPAAI
jgi:signal transduction histidine kinase